MQERAARRYATQIVVAGLGLGLLAGCGKQDVGHLTPQARLDESAPAKRPMAAHGGVDTGVALAPRGGILVVPATINDAVQLPFIVDSGASDVSISADVVTALVQSGTISQDDFIGKRNYRLADGSTVPYATFRIRSLRVGDKVLQDVIGSVAPGTGGFLLGQSFLSRFRSWSIDNERMLLVLR